MNGAAADLFPMAFIVITGANRGVGLALARLYATRRDSVLAACRKASSELDQLETEVVTGVDVLESRGIERLVAAVAARRVDVLINNAGILVRDGAVGQLDYPAMRRQFETNALAPLRLTEALQPNLRAGSKVALISSRMGSIEDNTSGGRYGYRMSKAALNMAGKSLAYDLRGAEVAVAILHPGFVRTQMVDGQGLLEPDESAAGLAERIDELSLETTGGFWHANGQRLPW